MTASVLVTGPTRGLGIALLTPLAERDPAGLVLLGRASLALDDSVAQIRALTTCPLLTEPVDLADLQSVVDAGRAVAAEVAAGHPPLTTVILNAGLQTSSRTQTSAQGYELTYAVNVLAQHVLLRALQPALASSAHIVIIGSGTHFGDWHSFGMVPPPVWAPPAELATPDANADDPKAGGRAYSTSKLGVIYLAHAWQRRLAPGQRMNVADPGLMPGTGLARDLPRMQRWAWNNVLPGVSAIPGVPGVATPARAARRVVAFALGETHASLAGGYVDGAHVRQSSPESYDEARENELWDACEAISSQF